MRARFVLRNHVVLGCIALFALVLLGRLYIVQVSQGERFSSLAERQYVTPHRNIYDRGTIFFTDRDEREIAAATVRSGYLLAITPEKIDDAQEVHDVLAKYIELDEESFVERASRDDDPYEEVAHRIAQEDADAIDSEDLTGVQLFREHWRYYPGGTLAAHALGFEAYGADGQERSGRYGLERQYDEVLQRENKDVYVNFFAEIFSNLSDTLFAEGRGHTGDVVTTIDPSVQVFLEDTLKKVNEEYRSKKTGGIIIDPMTGAIYALALDPSFDVNTFSDADPELFKNSLVEDVFEMGSIIKPITVAIGLDDGVVTADTVYHDAGKITLDGYTIGNYDGRARGDVPMQEVLNQSLNTGVAYIADKVGHKTFREYMLAFGLGEKTGIDLPNEIPGLVSNLDSPRAVEYATASFGQGIALTPIATVRALSVLANGGTLITPHVVKEITYDTGETKKIEHSSGERVITEQTSEEISRMLTVVVDEALRGGTVSREHYSIAAKTGTAQIATRGGYFEDRFMHTFFGYFPSYEPRFLVFLYTIEPRGVRYASETLTLPFMDVVDYLINYYEVPPDR